MVNFNFSRLATIFSPILLIILDCYSILIKKGVFISNIVILIICVIFFLLFAIKFSLAKLISGIFYGISGLIIIFGFFSPLDGNKPEFSIMRIMITLILAITCMYLSALCLKKEN